MGGLGERTVWGKSACFVQTTVTSPDLLRPSDGCRRVRQGMRIGTGSDSPSCVRPSASAPLLPCAHTCHEAPQRASRKGNDVRRRARGWPAVRWRNVAIGSRPFSRKTSDVNHVSHKAEPSDDAKPPPCRTTAAADGFRRTQISHNDPTQSVQPPFSTHGAVHNPSSERRRGHSPHAVKNRHGNGRRRVRTERIVTQSSRLMRRKEPSAPSVACGARPPMPGAPRMARPRHSPMPATGGRRRASQVGNASAPPPAQRHGLPRIPSVNGRWSALACAQGAMAWVPRSPVMVWREGKGREP